MSKRNLLAAAALVLATGAVFAQSTPAPTPSPTPAPGATMPGVDAKEAADQARIKAGKENGSLTHREAHRLQREQGAVKRAEAKAEADGTVTAKEQHRIDRMQRAESKDIYRQKHDKQHRKTASAPAN